MAAGSHSSEEAAAAAGLDLSILEEWCGEDAAMLTATLQMYSNSLKSDLAGLAAAVTSNDGGAVGFVAHRVKGSARTVGCHRVVEPIVEIEAAALRADWATIETEMPRLWSASDDIERYLMAIKAA